MFRRQTYQALASSIMTLSPGGHLTLVINLQIIAQREAERSIR